MKKIIPYISIISIIILVTLSLKELTGEEYKRNSITSTGNPNPDSFLIGAYSIGCAEDSIMENLGFNIWHKYLGNIDTTISGYNQHKFPQGVTSNDKLFENISSYQSAVTAYYIPKAGLNNNYLYLNRPKIEMLSFAQRSDYCNASRQIGQIDFLNKDDFLI
ncbi:MAG: hypothetical protein NTV87_00230 [Ignavibacteriae bacterium]|nr:hypothetical protein [Ignavibacteriota bacterium]